MNSIVLLQAGALGDTVLQLRIGQALRRAAPEARILWIGRDAFEPLAQLCQCVDEAQGADAIGLHRLFGPDARLDVQISPLAKGHDLIISSMADEGSPLTAHLRRAAGAVALYDTKPARTDAHALQQWLERIAAQVEATWPQVAKDLSEAARPLVNRPDVLLAPRDEDVAQAAELLRMRPPPGDATALLVLVHPGSGGTGKCWPIEQYGRLVRLLAQRWSRLAMLVGPAEAERWAGQMDDLRRSVEPHPVYVVEDLPVLLGLLGQARAYVGNDAGPTHLAAALGVPTVALFGPTDPRVWRPLGPRVTVLSSREHAAGWTDLSAERAADAVASLLQGPA